MAGVIDWKSKKRNNFVLDLWISILKQLVRRTRVRTNFYRKNMPQFLRFMVKNDVNGFDWFNIWPFCIPLNPGLLILGEIKDFWNQFRWFGDLEISYLQNILWKIKSFSKIFTSAWPLTFLQYNQDKKYPFFHEPLFFVSI